MIELSRYILEALRKDAEFILYRARSKDDGTQLLVLSPAGEHPRPESLKRLEHEYFLKEALDPRIAARPIEIARDLERTILVLEDPGGVPLDQLLGQPLARRFLFRSWQLYAAKERSPTLFAASNVRRNRSRPARTCFVHGMT